MNELSWSEKNEIARKLLIEYLLEQPEYSPLYEVSLQSLRDLIILGIDSGISFNEKSINYDKKDTSVLSDKEKKLAAYFLNHASEKYSNHGCNDVDESVWKDWTTEERQEFVKEFCEWNGDPENYDPNFLHMQDMMIMAFLADKLKSE